MKEYTSKDALSSVSTEERRDFRLRLTSTSIGLSALSDNDSSSESQSMPVTANFQRRPAVETESVESCTLASITERDGRLIIEYDDAIDDDESPVPTKLSFAVGEPGLITLERKGFLRSVMIFEAGKRHRAIYKTPFAGFEMTVFSRTVENSLTPNGGKLRLDYAVEFRGAAEQKVSFTLEAARI
jgi:uncharacterized beta-barrel protein YwiB (DUF1934 family)